MRVFVYFNLHKKCWSIRSLTHPTKGRVIAHSSTVLLADATFKVSISGRNRVLREKRKNVHAGVTGILLDSTITRPGSQVSYNPYKCDYFYKVDTFEKIESAPVVEFRDNKVFIHQIN